MKNTNGLPRSNFTRRDLMRMAAVTGLGAASLSLFPRGAVAQTSAPQPSDDLISAAKAEGTLTFYHTTAIDPTAVWTGAFTKKYGITTQNVRGPSYPLFERWLTEERVGQHVADVVQITDTVLIESAHDEKLIADYTPTSAAGIRPEMKKEGVWYTAFVNAMGIAWNSKLVSPEEEKLIREGGWNVLTDPRWKGRIATGTPASGGSSYSYVYMFLGGNAISSDQIFLPRWQHSSLRFTTASRPCMTGLRLENTPSSIRHRKATWAAFILRVHRSVGFSPLLRLPISPCRRSPLEHLTRMPPGCSRIGR